MPEKLAPQQCFERLKDEILAIADKEHASINLPPEEAMQETVRVGVLVDKYDKALRNTDIDHALLDTIHLRSGALAHSVAQMDAYVKAEEKDKVRYLELKKDAYKHRTKVLDILEYVFRKNPPELESIAVIRSGQGDPDMIKDHLSIHNFGTQYRERLIKAHVDMALIERCQSLYGELSALTAALDVDPKKVVEARNIYMKTWTYTWRALEEIYQAGRCAFYDQPQIKELFYIDYRQEISKAAARTQPAPAAA